MLGEQAGAGASIRTAFVTYDARFSPIGSRIPYVARFSANPPRLDEDGVARRALAEMGDQGAPSTVGPRSLYERGQLF